MATKLQIIADSNNTYVDNTTGNITPTTVKALNTDWINASIFPEDTGSMSVRSAATASFLLGSVASASFSAFAVSASQSTNALTASFLLGSVSSASLAANSLLLQGTGSNGFATTASLTAVSSSNQQLSASYIALSGSYNTFSGSASTRITNTSQSLQAVSASTQQVSASYIALSASYNVFSGSASARITAVSSSDQQTSASYVALSGSYNIFSGSASTRITNLESFSSSLDATFATDAQLNAATQSLSASTSTVNTRVTEVSGSLLQVSASYIALSGSYNTFSGSESARTTRLESTASSLVAASASFSTRVSDNTSNIQTLTSATASYAVLANNQTFTGKNTFNNDVTASNVRITGTASIAFLDVTFQSSSVIYSSGSNQFGDASNDTQTLFGTVNVVTGPLVVTGSANFKETITGSISGNAAFATNAEFATTASLASFAVIATAALTASYATTASSAEKSFEAVSSSYAFTASSAISSSFASVAATVLGTITSASFATSASRAISAATVTSASFATSALTASSVQVDSFNNINSPFYFTLVNGINDVKRLGSDTDLSYNPNTNLISGQIESALSASSLYTENYNNINSTYYLTMVDNASGWKRYGLDTDLSYNPSTNVLSATVQSAATASSITIDNYNGSNTTYYLTMVTDASGAKRVGLDTDLSYNPSTNLLTGLITSASYAFTASSAVNATNALTASSLTALNQTVTITGSVNVSGSIRISQGDDLITHHVQAAASNGLELQNNGGNVIALLGAGGGLGTTFNGQVNATAFSGSGALVYGVVSSSYAYTASSATNAGSSISASYAYTASSATSATSASYAYTASSAISSSFALTASYLAGAVSAFPFTGSAGITGSLDVVGALYIPSGSIEITGSATIISGSLTMFSYKDAISCNTPFQALITQSLDSTNNIISVSTVSGATGSIVISGSGNYVSLSQLVGNSSFDQGRTQGFNGTNAYITVMPIITGSNPNFNTATDRNNRRVPTITNSNVNAAVTFTDNRASQATNALTISNSSINSTITSTVDSGSLTISNSNIAGTGLTVSSSNVLGGTGGNGSISNCIISGNTTNIRLEASGSRAASINTSIIGGTNTRLLLSASAATTIAPTISSNLILGDNIIVTSSYNAASQGFPVGSAFLGSFNAADGVLNSPAFTRFAIGTGTGASVRRTSFHVSASGLTTINDSLDVRGINSGLTELEVRTTGVKIGNLLTDAHNLTGSFSITGSQTITGSLIGQPVSQSVSSNTASLNLATGNFFNLTLPASVNTYITASGQIPGQTVNIKVTQGATVGTLSFGAGFKQASGSFYTGSQVTNAVDIVTLISFDNTGIYVSNVNNLI